MHPNRLRFAIFSDENPAMRLVAESAEQIRKSRKPVAEDNPLAVAEKSLAKAIGGTLTAFGEARDAMTERMFHFTYGSPLIHALVGLDAESATAAREPERDAAREKVQAGKRQQLEARFDKGGAVEAALRAIAFVLKGEGAADERSFAVIKSIHDAGIPGRSRSHAEFKKLLTDQSLLLRLDEERAIKAIPKLLPKSAGAKAKLLNAIQRVVGAQGELNAEGNRRLARVEKLFGPKATARKG